MSILQRVTPLNLQEEQDRFFESSSYNPHFQYATTLEPEELHQWGLPNPALATFVLDHLNLLPEAKSEAAETFLTKHEITTAITELSSALNLEKTFQVVFSEDLISKCRIDGLTIYFKEPILYYRHELDGVLNHEIQTHHLRKINNRTQPWANTSRPDYVFRSTEEGLAALHTYYGSQEPSMHGTMTAYVGVYLAHRTSFREAYQELRNLGLDEQRAWRLTVRGKRGVTDTSQPTGGLTKDISYLEGAIAVWRWLMNNKNDPHDLYLGRVGLEELSDRKKEATLYNLKYPLFFSKMDKYKTFLLKLGQNNFLDKMPV